MTGLGYKNGIRNTENRVLWPSTDPPGCFGRDKVTGTRINQENCTVAFTAQAEAPPVREDAVGAVRVGESRVLLELVVRAFQDGATPETIVQRYSTLTLSDAYAVIAYYLRHRNEVEAYLARREQKAEEVRQRIASQQGDLSDIRARLLAQRRP
jgi:uncharacterized protein (DUF433 family)